MSANPAITAAPLPLSCGTDVSPALSYAGVSPAPQKHRLIKSSIIQPADIAYRSRPSEIKAEGGVSQTALTKSREIAHRNSAQHATELAKGGQQPLPSTGVPLRSNGRNGLTAKSPGSLSRAATHNRLSIRAGYPGKSLAETITRYSTSPDEPESTGNFCADDCRVKAVAKWPFSQSGPLDTHLFALTAALELPECASEGEQRDNPHHRQSKSDFTERKRHRRRWIVEGDTGGISGGRFFAAFMTASRCCISDLRLL